jgi:hypothetical protein
MKSQSGRWFTERTVTPAVTQRRSTSLVESVVNCVIGIGVAFLMQVIAFPMFDIHIPLSTSGWIALLFTGVSIVRSYVLRRAFEWLRVTGLLR